MQFAGKIEWSDLRDLLLECLSNLGVNLDEWRREGNRYEKK